jgi:hypothetical protein
MSAARDQVVDRSLRVFDTGDGKIAHIVEPRHLHDTLVGPLVDWIDEGSPTADHEVHIVQRQIPARSEQL